MESSFNGARAVLLAAKYCNQYPLFEWREEALPSIGRRAEKYCFRVDMVNLLQDRCGEMVLTLFPVQQSFLDFQKENTLYKLKMLLVTLKHPYLLPTVDIFYSKEKQGLLIVQPFVREGSLKDRIHGASPTLPYQQKYRMEGAAPLPLTDIARFGRQILDALVSLRSKGIVCDHLSTGNVLIDDGNARISDIYTPLLALDRHKESRELTVPLEAKKVEIDLLLFGHVLYEMATGLELTETVPDEGVLELLAPEIADVLWLIFYPSRVQEALSSMGNEEDELAVEGDDTSSVSTMGSSSSRYVLRIDTLQRCELFADADVAPIETLFAGFRFDSGTKSTIKNSMRINASRSQAHVVHHNEKEALIRARQRAERRVYEEKNKQLQRIQQHAASRLQGPSSSGVGKPVRRKTYRADSFRSHAQRQLSRSSSGDATNETTTSA